MLYQGVESVAQGAIDSSLRRFPCHGFSDQSHFTNYFSRFIGLAPGIYRDIFKDMEELTHEG